MQSIVLKQRNGNIKAELVQTEKPFIDKEEVLVKVKYAGICGTDLKLYSGNYPVDKKLLPFVLGHEFMGTVTATGESASNFNSGERVVAIPTYGGCGTCSFCKEGEIKRCEKRNRMGFNCDGVFSEYVSFKESQLIKLPDTISDKAGALIEPLTVAVGGVYKANIKPSDTILVIGPGAIGLLTLLVAKQYGAKVLVSGTDADVKRLELAKKMGADEIIFSEEISKVDKRLTVDVILECSGNTNAIDQGLQILRAKGQYVQIGTASKKMNIDFMNIAYKELYVTGSLGASPKEWEAAISLMEQQQIQHKALLIIKETLPIADFKKGFQDGLENGGPKTLLKP